MPHARTILGVKLHGEHHWPNGDKFNPVPENGSSLNEIADSQEFHRPFTPGDQCRQFWVIPKRQRQNASNPLGLAVLRQGKEILGHRHLTFSASQIGEQRH